MKQCTAECYSIVVAIVVPPKIDEWGGGGVDQNFRLCIEMITSLTNFTVMMLAIASR